MRFHKIVHGGEVYYREMNESTGYYTEQILSYDELIEQLIEEVVDEVIEIDKGQVERAVSCIPNTYQKEIVQNYIDYLERLVESLE